MNLYFLLALRRSPSPNPILVETFAILRKRGFNIEVGMGQDLLLQLGHMAVTRDLYVLKSHTALWLSLAEIIHARGGRLLNPFPACLAVQNKIVAVERMRAGGVPTPRSWVTGNPNLLRAIVEEHPVIIKPYNGGRGLGIRIVQRLGELATSRAPSEPVVVQEYIRHDDEVKVYVIGEEVFGIRMRSGDGRRWSCPISDEVREIALRCGRLFGLRLYGLDVIESAEGPLVVDINYFPSYRDVPNAAALLADFIEGYALAAASTRLRRKMGGIGTVIRASAQ